MTIYLLVAAVLCTDMSKPKDPPHLCENMPTVQFFLDKNAAAAAYDKNGGERKRLFSVYVDNFFYPCRRTTTSECIAIKELNVHPAQTYEVSDKNTVTVEE